MPEVQVVGMGMEKLERLVARTPDFVFNIKGRLVRNTAAELNVLGIL